jgi:hypothetical protein
MCQSYKEVIVMILIAVDTSHVLKSVVCVGVELNAHAVDTARVGPRPAGASDTHKEHNLARRTKGLFACTKCQLETKYI